MRRIPVEMQIHLLNSQVSALAEFLVAKTMRLSPCGFAWVSNSLAAVFFSSDIIGLSIIALSLTEYDRRQGCLVANDKPRF
jgi:hypothetical protein